MALHKLLEPRNLLLALCLGAAAGACSIDTDDDDAGDDGDACHEDCGTAQINCEGDCDDGDDSCIGRCGVDFDECDRDCD
jgi:hypothetical protein